MTCNIVSSITNSSISEMNHIRTCTIVNTFGKNRLPNGSLIEITSWLVSAYDFYSRVVKDR